MTDPYYLTLWQTILININIMLGSGIFLNTTILAQRAGIVGALSYIIIGILMLPLILSIVALLRIYPTGGFYTYAQKEIHPFAGFISSWSYFVGKLASATLVIHMAISLLQQVIPFLFCINTFLLDLSIIILFTCLNLLNIRTGSTIQNFFFAFKTIPIFFTLFASLYIISFAFEFPAPHVIWKGIPSTLPLVLYAIAGFEAACSLSSRIKNAPVNAPRAVLISYTIVISILFLYQLMFYLGVGNSLGDLPDYRYIFPALVHKVTNNQNIIDLFISFLHIAIASSALGGSYGILFSNNWNLYTLAKHKHILHSSLFAQLNRHQIPWLCVLAEGVICILYLLVSAGSQIPLQQTSALGLTIAYTLSIIAAFKASSRQNLINPLIPFIGLINCSLLFAICVQSLLLHGMSSLLVYSVLLAIGTLMFCFTKKMNTNEA